MKAGDDPERLCKKWELVLEGSWLEAPTEAIKEEMNEKIRVRRGETKE